MSGIVRFFASSLPLWEASDGAAVATGVTGGGGDQAPAAQEQAQQQQGNDGDGPTTRAGSGQPNASAGNEASAAAAASNANANANNPSSGNSCEKVTGASANGAAAGQASKPGPTMSVGQYGQSLIPPGAAADNSGTADAAADTVAAAADGNAAMEVEQPAAATSAANDSAACQQTTTSLTYEEWSALRRKAFERYMNRRMVSPSSSSPSSSSQSSSSSTSDGGGNNKQKKTKRSKKAAAARSPSQDTADSSLLLSASSGSPASSTGLLSSIDGSPPKKQAPNSPDGKAEGRGGGGGGVDDVRSDDDEEESRNSIDGSPLPEYATAANDGEILDESMFDDADIPETDIFQVFEDDADYHHGRERPLETQEQPETQEQEQDLPETQEDPLPVQQSQSQSPESQSQSQSQMMDTQPLLESQPETQQEEGTMMLGQNSQQGDDDDEEEEDVEDLPDTQDATQKSPDVVPMDVDVVPESSSAKKRKKSDKKKATRKKKEEDDANRRRRKDRRKILHESQTRGTANTVEQVNLRVHTVNLGLCRVVTVWPVRKTKRLHWQAADATSTPAASASDGDDTPAPAKVMGGLRILSSPYGDFEDDGPLGNIYRSVLTLEVEEVVDEEREEALREQRRLFQRPFELTDEVEDDEGGDKTKDPADEAAVLTAKTRRRIRVFLYGKYATKVSRLLSEWKYRATPNSKTCALAGEGREEVLLSLNNVPARCVFPYYGRTSEAPILDNELGRCSRYCLCIGSNSHLMVTSGDAEEGEKERFDTVNSVGSAADLEMRIVMVRKAAAPVIGSPSQVEIQEVQAQRNVSSPTFTSTAESILSLSAIERKQSEGPGPNASDLAARYGMIVTKKEQKIQELIDEARGEGNKNDQDENMDAAQREQETGGNGDVNQAEAPTANPGEGAVGQEGEQARKRRRTSTRYHTLAELQPFLDALKSRRQDMQSGRRPYHRFDDSTNVYAIALSSSAPYRTKRGDWMVSVLLIDESLPPTKLVNDSNENNSNADNTPANSSAPSGTLHVPSISMNVFNPDKSKLPVIRYAGDVIRAHRVAVQEYNGDIQLVGRRNSSFYVVRPRNEKLMMESPQGQGWVESYTASKPSMLDVDDYLRLRELWRWGRKRFSEHPILHGKERISIADVGPVDDLERAMAGVPIERTVTNGDLIAMVTAIIPQPPEQVSDRTPWAFLRLWDGTGRPESDPFLVDGVVARQAMQEGDPPASVLTAISKIGPTLTKDVSGDDESEAFEPPKCLCGRVINVAIWEGEQWERIRSNESGIRIGKFVRLKNVNDGRLGTENPKRCLMAHQKTSIIPIPDQTFEIRSLLQAHNARVLRKDPPNPSSGILPLSAPAAEEAEAAGGIGATDTGVPANESTAPAAVAEPQRPQPSLHATSTSPEELFSLAEVIGGPDETEPATFKSRFTVYGTIPEVDVDSGDGFKDLCVPADPDDETSEELAYEFSLSIRDDSAEVNVIVLNDVAETFFMSVTASDVCKKGGTRGGRRRPKEFNQGLKDLRAVLAEDAVWEGDICTAILEDEKYFVLKSLTRVNDDTGA